MTQDNSRRIFRIIVGVLLSGVILTGIFGWFVMQNVRETANRTDLDMRCLAWASIAYACTHDGRFPVSADELFEMSPLPERISCVPSGDQVWPVTLVVAMRGESAPTIEESFGRLDMAFSSDGSLPPRIGVRGLPTLIDPPTKDTVREWLSSFPAAAGR